MTRLLKEKHCDAFTFMPSSRGFLLFTRQALLPFRPRRANEEEEEKKEFEYVVSYTHTHRKGRQKEHRHWMDWRDGFMERGGLGRAIHLSIHTYLTYVPVPKPS